MTASSIREHFNDVDEFKRNFTHVPDHLISCVFHEYKLDLDHLDHVSNAVELGLKACRWIYFWEKLLTSIAIVIGIPGNIMAAVVSLSMQRLTSSVYLAALAIGDLMTIIFRAVLPTTGFKAFEVFKMTIGFYPNVILVFICFERYMAVCQPWKKRRLLTLRVAYLSIAGAVVLLFIVFLICLAAHNNAQVDDYDFNFLLAFFLFAIPCPFIVVFNSLTIRRLREMSALQNQTSVYFSFWSKAEASITFMIIIASVAFVCLNGPHFLICTAWFVYTVFFYSNDIGFHVKVDFAINLAYWLTFLHHAVMFYLYILGTKRFRMHFIYLVKRWMRLESDSTDYPTPGFSLSQRSDPTSKARSSTKSSAVTNVYEKL